jgi:hypothetical protein
LLRVASRIENTGLTKRVAPLAAFTALAAVTTVARVHTRQRQVHRDPKFLTEPDHVALVQLHEGGVYADLVCESE